MSRILFERTSLDDMLGTGRAHSGRNAGAPVFEPRGTIDLTPTPDVMVADEPATRRIFDLYRRNCAAAHGTPTGHLTFNDIYVIGERGLMVDLNTRRIWCGESLLWSPRFVARRRHNMGWLREEEPGVFSIPRVMFSLARRHRSATLASAPGFRVYGHWLMDVLPRLVRLSRHPRAGEGLNIHPRLNGWKPALARAAGVSGVLGAGVGKRSLMHVDALHTTTSLRMRRSLDVGAMRAAAEALRRGLDDGGDYPDFGTRIYVSRRGIRADERPPANLAPFEALLKKAGFREVRPEQHSLAAQAAIFRRARDIVGLDGSGLHNSIFAEPGARIVSIGQRDNLFHIALASLMAQQILYVKPAHSEQLTLPWWRLRRKIMPLTIDLKAVERALDLLGPAPRG